MFEFDFNSLDIWKFQASAISFLIILLLFISLRLLKGFIANVSTSDEIAEKDNAAFGVSFAGGITALAIMLTGASSGEYADSMLQDAISMLVFGAIGLVMITIGRFIQDKVVMRNVAILEEIKKGNLAAAFVDIGNVIAVGIVIRASMIWVETEGWIAIPIIFAAFIVSQVVLVGGAIYRINLFKSRNNGSDCNCMQQALEDGNHALGIRYAGYMIGLSLAITAASGMVAYSAENIIGCVISWAIAALVFSIAFMVFVAVARMAILPGIKVSDEVDKQKNASVGVIEAAIAVAIGLTFVSLFG